MYYQTRIEYLFSLFDKTKVMRKSSFYLFFFLLFFLEVIYEPLKRMSNCEKGWHIESDKSGIYLG